MGTQNNLPNYRCIKVKFLQYTNFRCARIKLFEPICCSSQRIADSITLSYDYKISNVLDQAVQFLDKNGFKPVCRAYDIETYYIFCDNYGEDYKKLSECKETPID
jgi:hypothetical protein